MNKPIATFDADGVVIDWFSAALDFINAQLGTKVSYEEVYDHNIAGVFGISEAQVQAVIDQWYGSEPLGELLSIEGAIEHIERISHYVRPVIITSRRDTQKRVTQDWFTRYLPGIPVIFSQGAANPSAGGKNRSSKQEIAEKLRSICLVEDNPYEFVGWQSTTVEPICFAQPWNENICQLVKHRKIERMKWPRIEQYLLERVNQ